MEGHQIGRYVLGAEIASGGMASVFLGRMRGPAGFGKTVALKRLHTQYARDGEFVKMFHDEARLTSGLSHPNIVMTLDVLEEEDSLYLVMEYVHGASLTQIVKRADPEQKPVPLRITTGIIASMLDGLHAAHEASDENGTPLGVVHRDVSPQNVLVSFQGVAKIADFGIAKAAGRASSTSDGSAKGKVSYMAPEQVLGTPITAQTDVYAAGIVLWEALTGQRLIDGSSTAESVRAVLQLVIDPPSSIVPEIPPELDKVVLRAVERSPVNRFRDAKEMATALRKAVDVAHPSEIGDWLRAERPDLVQAREKSLAELQRTIGATSLNVPISRGQTKSDPNLSERGSGPAESSIPSDSVALANAGISMSNATGHRPKWLLPALTISFAFGIAGLALVMVATRNRSEATTTPTAAGSLTTSAASATASVAIAEPSASAQAPGTIEVDDVPATTTMTSSSSAPVASATTSATVAPKLHPSGVAVGAPGGKRKCRIVTSIDSAGHTKFTEVCQ